MEVRDPSSSPSTSGHTSRGKTVGKESSSSSKKGKKKATIGTCGIEEVVGSLGVGVSKPSAPDERDEPVAESGPSTRSIADSQEKEGAAQVDGNDDLYATEEEDDAEEAGDDVGSEADLRPRKKRRSLRNGTDTGGETGDQPIQNPTATTSSMSVAPAVVTEPIVAQGLDQQEVPPTEISMVIDPALEGPHVPPRAGGSDTDT